MADLTDEAKSEIAEAIRIVKEDRQHAMLRDIHSRTTPKAEPPEPKDPPKDPKETPPTPTPPPAKDPADNPPEPKKTGLWWGDRLK